MCAKSGNKEGNVARCVFGSWVCSIPESENWCAAASVGRCVDSYSARNGDGMVPTFLELPLIKFRIWCLPSVCRHYLRKKMHEDQGIKPCRKHMVHQTEVIHDLFYVSEIWIFAMSLLSVTLQMLSMQLHTTSQIIYLPIIASSSSSKNVSICGQYWLH